MVGAAMRLLSQSEADRMFEGDPEYQKINKQQGVSPYAIELKYQAATNAAFTEIGTSVGAEFIGGAREKTTVLCKTRVVTPGGSYFTFYVIDSSGTITTYYAWFSKIEIFTAVCATRILTPGSSKFTWQDSEGAPTTYYGYFTKKEVFTVSCKALADCVESSYFTFQDSEAVPTTYYVWLNKGAGADPTPGGTGIEADISGATTATDVAAIIAPLINAKGGCVSGNVAELVTVTMATKGDPTDAADGNTTFTITVTENGGADPTGTGTGVEFDISGATTANDVGVIVAAAIDALGGSGAANSSGTVTVTMATKGDPTDAADVDTGYTITVTENGGADPGATGTGAECDIKAATTADDVGTIVAAIIDALGDVGAANASGTVTITNDEIGAVTETTDFDTLYTITQVEDSSNALAGAPLYIVSAAADDINLATKDVRHTQLIGFYKDANGRTHLKTEEFAMAGATPVKSAELKWIRALHTKGINWGSAGADAKGAITLQDVAASAFIVIAINTNESEGGVIWVPNNWHAAIALMDLSFADVTLATAGDGAIVKAVGYGLDETKNNRGNIDPDNPAVASVAITRENPHKVLNWPTKAEIHGTDVGKLTFMEAAINNAQTIDFTAYIILWYKSNS